MEILQSLNRRNIYLRHGIKASDFGQIKVKTNTLGKKICLLSLKKLLLAYGKLWTDHVIIYMRKF